MEKEMIFHVLGIPETKNEDEIRNAYRAHLKETNPEDDPEGFKRLREAYEAALAFARQVEEAETESAPETEVDVWLKRVDAVYLDITLRCQPEEWKELLEDPVCEGLDTSLEARDKMLIYLMDHIYLPQEIWRLLDKKFQFLEEMEILADRFPKNFLEYVRYYVEYEGFLPLNQIQVINNLEYQVDSYLQKYLAVKKSVDREEVGKPPYVGHGGEEPGKEIDHGTNRKNLKELDDLAAFGVWLPYEDVERIRILLFEDRVEEAAVFADKLMAVCPDDNYVGAYVGWTRYRQGRREEAYELWQKVLERAPAYYEAKMGTVKCLLNRKDYYQARERMMDILELDGGNQEVMALLKEANEVLIGEFGEKLKRHEKDERLPEGEMALELGWCLFQNERIDEAVRFLGGLKVEKEQEYGYSNLYGRVLYQAKKYEEALPHLEKWLELIEAARDDGSEENKKRRSRLGRACYILGGCLHSLGREEEAETYVKRAVAAASNLREKMGCLQYLATIFCESKQYARAVDTCDEILKEDENYYPAYLTRQEACFELKKAQEVVDDYHRAVNIFPVYYKPYLYAAKVFYYYNQFEDAKGVFERARENHVEFSPQMKLFEVKTLRNLARSNEERKRPIELCRELSKDLEGETDIEDKSEVEFEMALLYWDMDENKEAVSHINRAIEQNKERVQYRLVRGNIYREMKRYSDALTEYEEAKSVYGNMGSFYYNVALCYEGKGLLNLAVENYEKTVQIQEGYQDALEKLSDYYHDKYKTEYRREDYEKALLYMNRQVALEENCYYLVCRGRIYMSAFQFERAIADFEKALEYEKTDWAAFNNIGCCYKYMGQYEKAISYFERAVENMENRKNVLPYSNMADCYEALEQYEKAVDCYQKDLEMFPDTTVFWTEIGKLYCYLERYEEAEEAFKKTTALSDYYKNMGDLLYRQGKRAGAYFMLRDGVKKAEAGKKGQRLCDLGEFCLEYLHQYPLAAYWLKKGAAAEADHSVRFECEWRLAWTYFLMKKPKKAKIHGERALEQFKQRGTGNEKEYLEFLQARPARLLRMAWIYIAVGEREKGLSLFEDMDGGYCCRMCRSRGCYEKYLYMGAYYEAAGHEEQAEKLYETALSLRPHSMEVRSAIDKLRKKRKR